TMTNEIGTTIVPTELIVRKSTGPVPA
ncbi:MAG: hypothetical protein QOD27_1651, partial [Microbacteriaceae bacterium]|nr:hypothetical protein [Microbacteriaceae bacterium]